jgi:hypothetical protein
VIGKVHQRWVLLAQSQPRAADAPPDSAWPEHADGATSLH